MDSEDIALPCQRRISLKEMILTEIGKIETGIWSHHQLLYLKRLRGRQLYKDMRSGRPVPAFTLVNIDAA